MGFISSVKSAFGGKPDKEDKLVPIQICRPDLSYTIVEVPASSNSAWLLQASILAQSFERGFHQDGDVSEADRRTLKAMFPTIKEITYKAFLWGIRDFNFYEELQEYKPTSPRVLFKLGEDRVTVSVKVGSFSDEFGVIDGTYFRSESPIREYPLPYTGFGELRALHSNYASKLEDEYVLEFTESKIVLHSSNRLKTTLNEVTRPYYGYKRDAYQRLVGVLRPILEESRFYEKNPHLAGNGNFTFRYVRHDFPKGYISVSIQNVHVLNLLFFSIDDSSAYGSSAYGLRSSLTEGEFRIFYGNLDILLKNTLESSIESLFESPLQSWTISEDVCEFLSVDGKRYINKGWMG